MSHEAWEKGYQEIKNIIHNDIGITKEEILTVFQKIAKEEIHKILSEKSTFVHKSIREVIREEMIKATLDHKYPKIRQSIWNYTDDISFKDYITGVMKEEIMNMLTEQFDIKVDVEKKGE